MVKMKESLYRIKIVLKESNPKIWRRIVVPSDLLLSDFHKIIQTIMGWTNTHLHQFIKDNTFYVPKYPEDAFWEDSGNVDYSGMKISDL